MNYIIKSLKLVEVAISFLVRFSKISTIHHLGVPSTMHKFEFEIVDIRWTDLTSTLEELLKLFKTVPVNLLN